MSLEVRQLCKTFRDPLTLKKRQVLFNVEFSVPDKSITGFLGGNGMGKTTSMKCILGLLNYQQGEISFFNNKYPDFRQYIGYMPERPYFYEYLTGMEFLTFYGQLSLNISKKALREKAEHLLEKVGIAHAKDKLLRSYSKGMLQRVGLAQAIIHDPKFLILDEPMSGLDPDGRYQVAELIRELGAAGTTIFFSSHLLDDIEKLCSRLVIINTGKILYQGNMSDFLKRTDKQFEVTATVNNKIVKENAATIAEVMTLLKTIENQNGKLISVQEPKMALEQAYTEFRKQAQI
ncbi:MAG: ABC transporter ATP-binding protein [Bdellovibrionaceae bacterium]|nr:ABC transporter ATP-binding protein [Pseudobdellovibrionaceae bacterium]